MEKGLLLKAEIREHTGSRSSANIRRQGCIPAVVYGHKKDTVAISLDAHNFAEEVHHGHRLLDLQIGKAKEKVIIKDLQYDHLGKNIIHADLMRVDVTEMIKVTVSIELKGVAKGTHEGGIIEMHTDHLEIECRATDIPESIVVSVKELGIGDTVHASDVELPAGVKLVTDPSVLLVTCSLVVEVKTTEEIEAEAPAAPEVIGEVKEPEQETPEED